MNIFEILNNNNKICEHNEYCSIYLSYLGKYGENSEEVKYCKNSNDQFCTKYSLVDPEEWEKMTQGEKLDLIKKLNKRS